jgi:hypothetical protein
MRTAWKAIRTLSRTCAHCCSGLSAAHSSAYAAGIQQETGRTGILDRRAGETAWQQPKGTGFELRPEVFGYLALQVAHLVREAALTRGVRRPFRRSRGSCPAPRHRPPAALRVLLAAPRRCGAERGKVRCGTVDRGLWGWQVGLAGLMAARIAGCDPIIAFDPLPSRLVLARELGATREDFRRDLRQLVMDEV